jgi:HD-GYP domain-containing protein (c-di-GMP phosphodiesterase class II)
MIKDHPVVGATLVSQVKGFGSLVPIIRHHHEHFDGGGYPDGLSGEDIPLEARILGVVDAFDAMTHLRTYRKALGKEEAIARLKDGAGSQFDPKVVKAFVTLLNTRGRELACPMHSTSETERPLAATASTNAKA